MSSKITSSAIKLLTGRNMKQEYKICTTSRNLKTCSCLKKIAHASRCTTPILHHCSTRSTPTKDKFLTFSSYSTKISQQLHPTISPSTSGTPAVSPSSKLYPYLKFNLKSGMPTGSMQASSYYTRVDPMPSSTFMTPLFSRKEAPFRDGTPSTKLTRSRKDIPAPSAISCPSMASKLWSLPAWEARSVSGIAPPIS